MGAATFIEIITVNNKDLENIEDIEKFKLFYILTFSKNKNPQPKFLRRTFLEIFRMRRAKNKSIVPQPLQLQAEYFREVRSALDLIDNIFAEEKEAGNREGA